MAISARVYRRANADVQDSQDAKVRRLHLDGWKNGHHTSIMKYYLQGLAGLLLLTAAAAQWVQAQSDAITVKRPAELREAPSDGSRSLAALAAQAQVTRLAGRQGPWIEVRSAQGVSGWIHMFDVGAAAAPAPSGNVATGALRGLTSLLGGRTRAPAATGATATIGIRGLGAEDIANAQPNLNALSQVEAMRQDAAQGRQFGADAALTPQTVAALPVPALPAKAPGDQGDTGSKR